MGPRYKYILFSLNANVFYFPSIQMYYIFPQYKFILFSLNTNIFYFPSIQKYSIFPQYKYILFSLNTNVFYFPSIQMYSIFPQYKCILYFLNLYTQTCKVSWIHIYIVILVFYTHICTRLVWPKKQMGWLNFSASSLSPRAVYINTNISFYPTYKLICKYLLNFCTYRLMCSSCEHANLLNFYWTCIYIYAYFDPTCIYRYVYVHSCLFVTKQEKSTCLFLNMFILIWGGYD